MSGAAENPEGFLPLVIGRTATAQIKDLRRGTVAAVLRGINGYELINRNPLPEPDIFHAL